MEHMTECLVVAIEEMDAKIDANQEIMDAKADASQEEMDATIDNHNEKSAVLRGTLMSWMDIHQARTVSIQEEIKAEMDIH
jgi:hypothetical protein